MQDDNSSAFFNMRNQFRNLVDILQNNMDIPFTQEERLALRFMNNDDNFLDGELDGYIA